MFPYKTNLTAEHLRQTKFRNKIPNKRIRKNYHC